MAIKKKAARKKEPRPKTKKNPNGAGAKLIDINWVDVDNLCKIQCTGEEIASVLNIDYDTLQNACKREKNQKFSEYIGKKKLGGRASLRRRQWTTAQDGNPTMLIWLGKNMLDQSDKQEIEHSGGIGEVTAGPVSPLTEEDIELFKEIFNSEY